MLPFYNGMFQKNNLMFFLMFNKKIKKKILEFYQFYFFAFGRIS